MGPNARPAIRFIGYLVAQHDYQPNRPVPDAEGAMRLSSLRLKDFAVDADSDNSTVIALVSVDGIPEQRLEANRTTECFECVEQRLTPEVAPYGRASSLLGAKRPGRF